MSIVLADSSIHGVRYLGARCSHTARLFWIIVIGCSLAGMIVILLFTMYSYNETVNVNIDTSYLSWNSTFPAVSVCYSKGRTSQIAKFLEDYWRTTNFSAPKRSVHLWHKIAQNYLFLNPNNNIDDESSHLCHDLNETCNLDLNVMKELFFPSNCQDVFMDVKFKGRSRNCSDLFKYFLTEMGNCFIFNSNYHADMAFDDDLMKIDVSTRSRTLEFRYVNYDTINYMLYIHSPEDLPYFVTPHYSLRKYGKITHFLLSIIETHNFPEVKHIAIAKRKCRFPTEKLTPTLPYSFSFCFLHNRIELEMEACNCTIPTSPIEYKPFYCDFKGLECLNKANIKKQTKRVHYDDATKTCLQACNSLEINVIGENVYPTPTANEPAKVILEILNVPILRYQRRVSRTDLDFIVSLGGLGGLFFGISFLSIIELLYLALR